MILVLVRHFKTKRLALASWEGLPIQFESRDEAYFLLSGFIVDFIDTEFQVPWAITAEEWQRLQSEHRYGTYPPAAQGE
jgi:hypothetical protein